VFVSEQLLILVVIHVVLYLRSDCYRCLWFPELFSFVVRCNRFLLHLRSDCYRCLWFPKRFTFVVICNFFDAMDSPSFDLGIPLDYSKWKRTKRTKPIVRKKLAFTNVHNATLSLGISKQPANVFLALGSDIFSCVSDPASTFDVSNMPLVASSSPSVSLPDTGEDDEDVESAASAANDRWFQNRFNEFLIHINHKPLYQSLYEYSWEVLGTDLLPRFFKCLLKKDGSWYPSSSINNLLNACQRILRSHQRSQGLELLAASLPVLPRLNIRTNPIFARTIDCFEGAMRKSVKEQGNLPRRKVDIFTIEDERRILAHPEHSIYNNFGL
jgi:hypothetical protein